MPSHSKPRPLLARPHANFTCFNDGLCCTDIHALGPLTRSEAKAMKTLAVVSVEYNEDAEAPCMATSGRGFCHFVEDGKCDVHAQLGPEEKPAGCRRFPYGLVSTPDGGRVTTEHRCPCRTLGHRPALDLQDAERSLEIRPGRLEVDQAVPARIPLTRRKRVGWAAYLDIETPMLERLAAGEPAAQVLDSPPLPALVEGEWAVYAAEYFGMIDGTSGGTALGYFGDALLHLAAGHSAPNRERPWAPYFDRGIARSERPGEPADMYNDWLADEIWMFRWLQWGAFDRGRAEMATRLKIAQTIAARLTRLDVRPDQAAAEAIMIVDVATASSEWPRAVQDIDLDNTPQQ